MSVVVVVSIAVNLVVLTAFIRLRRNQTLRRIEEADRIVRTAKRQMRRLARPQAEYYYESHPGSHISKRKVKRPVGDFDVLGRQ